MFVIKRNGNKEEVLFDKITLRIKKLINLLPSHIDEEKFINATFVGQKVIGYIHNNITTEELDIESAKICVNLCTTHPLYSNLGGRILVSNLQKKTLESFSDTVFKIQEDTDFYDDKFYNWVIENGKVLDSMIDYNRDYMFDYFGFKTLEKAYLIKNQKTGHIYERPQHLFMRVASFLNMGDFVAIKETYDLLSDGYYIHATPTLFNSGSKRSQLSSCFLIGTDDSIDDITNTWKSVSEISKWGGGIGLHVSNVRSKGSLIKGTNGPSSGIIPMLQVYNSIARYVNQCFVGSTKIYSEKGLVPIDQLKVGDKVFTRDGTLQEIKKIYNDKYDKEVLDIKIIHNFDIPTSVTPEHPFLVVKNHKDEKNPSTGMEHEWIEAKNITEDDLITIPIPKYEKDNTMYNDSDCYMYGILLGYGYICNLTNDVEMPTGRNDNMIDTNVKNYLHSNMIQFRKITSDNGDIIRWSTSSKFKFNRNQLYDNNNVKQLDSVMMHLPISKVKWILKGLIDTCACTHSELILELTSLHVLESIRYILLRMKILTTCSIQETDSGLLSYLLVIPQTDEIAELLDIEKSEYTPFLLFGDNLYTRIKSIEKRTINELVYDLEMDTNHNYLTEIGLVHNGGKRKGSIAVYLEPHHADIFEFLDLRKNFGDENLRARDLFLALWVSDLFMKQVEKNSDWYLMCPDECPGLSDVWGDEYETLYWKYVSEHKYKKKIEARKLMGAIWESQQETGTPYITYKDNVNRKSNQKNIGTIKSSNLCNEIVEYSDKDEHAVCNLASIALSKMVMPMKRTTYIIYTKENCKYCKWAKEWITTNNHIYQEIKFDQSDYKIIEQIKEQIKISTKSNESIETITFPQIFVTTTGSLGATVKHSYIGGFDDMINKCCHSFDYDMLYNIAYVATKNLNQVIDINYYPTKETKKSNMRHRPVGLGIQGLADTLVQMRIPFDSEEAIDLNSKIMETIYFASLTASKDLSKERQVDVTNLVEWLKENNKTIPHYYNSEYELDNMCMNTIYHKRMIHNFEAIRDDTTNLGSYSTYGGSPISEGILQFDMWEHDTTTLMYNWINLRNEIKKYGVRNSLLVALMPTASTSQILGNNECFEFFTSNIYTRNTLAGDFPVINKYMVNDLISIGEWNTEVKDLIIANNGSIQYLENVPQVFKRLYQTQWELKQIWVLKAAKARGPFVDQTQSMNIFMEAPNDQKLNSCLFWGWKNGLKSGMYYLRTKPASHAIKFTVDQSLINKVKESEECEMCSA